MISALDQNCRKMIAVTKSTKNALMHRTNLVSGTDQVVAVVWKR